MALQRLLVVFWLAVLHRLLLLFTQVWNHLPPAPVGGGKHVHVVPDFRAEKRWALVLRSTAVLPASGAEAVKASTE